MPSLGSHLGMAHRAADRIGDALVDRHRGAFYLGATAPDIRILLRCDRERTHFFELDHFEPQDSVAGLLTAHPHLAAGEIEGETRAFVAGYITHLLMDQHYIQGVYRAYFGAHSPLSGDLRANVLDRAFQYELNRRELAETGTMAAVRAALDRCEVPTDLGFLDAGDLAEWLEVAVDVAGQPPDLGRLPRMITRHMEMAGYGPEEIERELGNGDVLLREAMEHVGEDVADRFYEQAQQLATDRVREFLYAG